ncbi:hypothetical protein SAMN05216389_104196 [Oceanobacillus limi]|uniref:Uncharacterized protein n=1 Tax=Oceanobacillus limi TaxID=930131 RepID=A0A1I0B5H8_9BACI|nr:hypothetical protein [Oceanobacillus limi]SET02118.1 hypothetical protein SAMN05216389_104196 [Oceanobacillus limi]
MMNYQIDVYKSIAENRMENMRKDASYQRLVKAKKSPKQKKSIQESLLHFYKRKVS